MTRSEEPDWQLRPAVPEDADAVARVFWETRLAAVPAMPAPVHDAADVRRHLGLLLRDVHEAQSPGGAVPGRREAWVAERSGQVLGYMRLEADWLDDLYVHPDAQGGGIGGALLELAKAQRPDGFSLWVFAANDRAREFYLERGLQQLEWTDGSGNEERAPDVRMAWPGERPLEFWRAQIDAVDADLARLLARRAALTAAVQRHKDVGGHPGRDPQREAEIAARMAAHAPALGPQRLARIMDVVISESLDADEG